MTLHSSYIGRFAPSPTGPLHLGSLFSALASFLEARSQQGLWLLRIDDLDTPRNVQGATDAILRILDAFGLHWDKQIVYQSQHLAAYAEAVAKLSAMNLLYRCTCSRKSLIDSNHTEAIYPNYCRNKSIPASKDFALRIKTEPSNITFFDQLQGQITENMALQHGDFIIQRKDHIIAYQLAVVVDDHLQGINHVLRGADLLDSCAKQCYLQHCLNLPTPDYLHVPVITGKHGSKLSKQDFAPAVTQHNSHQTLFTLLHLLQQDPPADLHQASAPELLQWAISHWDKRKLQNIHSIAVQDTNQAVTEHLSYELIYKNPAKHQYQIF